MAKKELMYTEGDISGGHNQQDRGLTLGQEGLYADENECVWHDDVLRMTR